MDASPFLPGNLTINLSGVHIPPITVAEAIYTLQNLFGGHGVRRCCLFDRKLSAERNVVECTFGRLKAMCRCLTACLAVGIQNVVTVIMACVMLHIICKEKKHAVLSNELSEPVVELPILLF